MTQKDFELIKSCSADFWKLFKEYAFKPELTDEDIDVLMLTFEKCLRDKYSDNVVKKYALKYMDGILCALHEAEREHKLHGKE